MVCISQYSISQPRVCFIKVLSYNDIFAKQSEQLPIWLVGQSVVTL